MLQRQPAETVQRNRASADERGQQMIGMNQSSLGHLLGYQIARARVPTKAAFYKHVGAPLDLRPVEFTVLMLILVNSTVTPTELARTLAVTPANITLLLDRLDGKGWIERLRSSSDRRTRNVSLTSAGAEVAQRSHRLSLDCEREVLAHLTSKERSRLFELLASVARSHVT